LPALLASLQELSKLITKTIQDKTVTTADIQPQIQRSSITTSGSQPSIPTSPVTTSGTQSATPTNQVTKQDIQAPIQPGSVATPDLQLQGQKSTTLPPQVSYDRPHTHTLLNTLNKSDNQNQSTSVHNLIFTPEFQAKLKNITQQFPLLSQLISSTSVKASVLNSGLFLESKLLNIISSSINNKELLAVNTEIVAKTDLKALIAQIESLLKKNQAVIIPKQLLGNHLLYKNMSLDPIINSMGHLKYNADLPSTITHAQVQTPAPNNQLFQLNNPLFFQAKFIDQLEGVLSRIVINQLHSRESSDQTFMNFEIPFRHADQYEVLQLKMREQYKNEQAQEGNKIWTVNLAFHLDRLGDIRIYITLDKQDLAIQFWSEQENSQKIFEQNFYLLKERLTDAGFIISQLSSFYGLPEAAKQEQKNSLFIISERV